LSGRIGYLEWRVAHRRSQRHMDEGGGMGRACLGIGVANHGLELSGESR
jgi:hypothetical protein